jgi:hypothetical protein
MRRGISLRRIITYNVVGREIDDEEMKLEKERAEIRIKRTLNKINQTDFELVYQNILM